MLDELLLELFRRSTEANGEEWKSSRRREWTAVRAVFSPPLGVYISPPPSASDALKDQWQHTERSKIFILAKMVNNQFIFQKKEILCML